MFWKFYLTDDEIRKTISTTMSDFFTGLRPQHIQKVSGKRIEHPLFSSPLCIRPQSHRKRWKYKILVKNNVIFHHFRFFLSKTIVVVVKSIFFGKTVLNVRMYTWKDSNPHELPNLRHRPNSMIQHKFIIKYFEKIRFKSNTTRIHYCSENFT